MSLRKFEMTPVSRLTHHRFETMIDFLMNEDTQQFIAYLRKLDLAYKANHISTQVFIDLLTSVNSAGFTPLTHALNCQNINNHFQLYFSILRYLFLMGIDQGNMSPQDYFDFLIKPNHSGFTPLLQALKSANSDNLWMVFNELRWIVAQIPQYEQSYFEQLFLANNAGFTPLLQALQAENQKNLEMYFNELERGVAGGFIKNQDYFNLLTRPSHLGFSPLHAVLKSKNKSALYLYFQALRHLLDDENIDTRYYYQILIQPNQGGYNPLHNAMISGKTCNLSIYIGALRDAMDSGYINVYDYSSMLIQPNQAGFTPLDEALRLGNMQNLCLYFNLLDHAREENWLSIAHYRALLTRPNHRGYTPVWEAARSGNLDLVYFFLTKLKTCFLEKEYQQIISYKINGDLPHCQNDKTASVAINQLLNRDRQRGHYAVQSSFNPCIFRPAALLLNPTIRHDNTQSFYPR